MQSPRYCYLVAEHDGAVLGFIAMRDKTHLFHLFVAAEHQYKGIAAALWQQARELAIRADGVSRFTVNSSLNAQPVYERFGFVRLGDAVQAHGIAFQPMQLCLG